jgi:hypothetical protein
VDLLNTAGKDSGNKNLNSTEKGASATEIVRRRNEEQMKRECRLPEHFKPKNRPEAFVPEKLLILVKIEPYEFKDFI